MSESAEFQAERGLQCASVHEEQASAGLCAPGSRGRRSGLKPALLVIGYGNTLRCDDGVGPKVAEAVAALNLPGVRTLACQQLSPEHADPVSQAGVVIFVDAAMDAPREVQFRKLEPAGTSQLMAHAADPRTMLALARDVFGHAPEAWWLTIPIERLDFGEELSPLARQGLESALAQIRILASESAS